MAKIIKKINKKINKFFNFNSGLTSKQLKAKLNKMSHKQIMDSII